MAQYKERAKIHELVPFRDIIALLAPLKGKKVLDAGCGIGNLSKIMISRGAKVVGVDASPKWIDYCQSTYKKTSNLEFHHTDIGSMKFLKNASFDAVVMNMVILNVYSLPHVKKVIKEIGRVLKPGGVFIFSDLHPLCMMGVQLPHIRYMIPNRGFSYFKDGADYATGIKQRNYKIEFSNKHWTLETLTSILEKENLYIYRLLEPTYKKSDPKEFQNFKIPEYLLFACRKIK